MPYTDNYLGELLKYMSDLEVSKSKNATAESKLRELEAKVAELEEHEREWLGERRILLRRIEDIKYDY